MARHAETFQESGAARRGAHKWGNSIPPFNREALVKALREDQAGQTTFPQFLEATWRAGIVQYEVDFEARKVSYYGCLGEEYVEEYPAVDLLAR